MKVKICGITDSKIAEFVDQCGCDFTGVVFYNKSLRYVEPKNSSLIANSIVKSRKVAVVVEPNMDFLNEIIINFKPDFIQFHGNLNHQYFLKFKNKYPDIGVIIGKNIV
jgi:phosphoribosylanthranilate isomerase